MLNAKFSHHTPHDGVEKPLPIASFTCSENGTSFSLKLLCNLKQNLRKRYLDVFFAPKMVPQSPKTVPQMLKVCVNLCKLTIYVSSPKIVPKISENGTSTPKTVPHYQMFRYEVVFSIFRYRFL